ncbi:hypothetical protein SVIOM342S_03977 [Streptomyces violaceorubidus]
MMLDVGRAVAARSSWRIVGGLLIGPAPRRGDGMRIGLLGTGPWADMVHAPALADHEDFVGAGCC